MGAGRVAVNNAAENDIGMKQCYYYTLLLLQMVAKPYRK